MAPNSWDISKQHKFAEAELSDASWLSIFDPVFQFLQTECWGFRSQIRSLDRKPVEIHGCHCSSFFRPHAFTGVKGIQRSQRFSGCYHMLPDKQPGWWLVVSHLSHFTMGSSGELFRIPVGWEWFRGRFDLGKGFLASLDALVPEFLTVAGLIPSSHRHLWILCSWLNDYTIL